MYRLDEIPCPGSISISVVKNTVLADLHPHVSKCADHEKYISLISGSVVVLPNQARISLVSVIVVRLQFQGQECRVSIDNMCLHRVQDKHCQRRTLPPKRNMIEICYTYDSHWFFMQDGALYLKGDVYSTSFFRCRTNQGTLMTKHQANAQERQFKILKRGTYHNIQPIQSSAGIDTYWCELLVWTSSSVRVRSLAKLFPIERFCPEAWLIEEMVTFLLELEDNGPYIAQPASYECSRSGCIASLRGIQTGQASMTKASMTMQCCTIKQFGFQQNEETLVIVCHKFIPSPSMSCCA